MPRGKYPIQLVPNITQEGIYTTFAYDANETYYNKEALKVAGAKWNGGTWIMTEEQANLLVERYPRTFTKTVWCNLDCACSLHFVERSFVNEEDAVVGTFVKDFCGHCDSQNNAKVVEVLDIQQKV